MNDTGECVLENRLISPHRLSRGDLATYISPLDPARIVCKRVIGIPGDVICVDPTGKVAPSTEHVIVPKGHLWMSGDNAEMSRDSRHYGPVSMALVKGKLVAKVFPFFVVCSQETHEPGRSGLLETRDSFVITSNIWMIDSCYTSRSIGRRYLGYKIPSVNHSSLRS